MTKKHDKPLHLDMSFDEALKRFAQTDPRELSKNDQAKPKKRKRRAKRKGAERGVSSPIPPSENQP